MGFGSGLAQQFGYAAESTVGTQVTVDHFLEHKKADFELDQRWLFGEGLRVSGMVPRTARSVQTLRSAKGSVELECPTSKLGLLIRHMLGSAVSSPTLVSGAAYKQVHQLGNAAGLGLTMQVGRPMTDGTVKPFTYTGCKIASWELSAKEGEALMLKVDVDAKDELTLATTPASNALAAASYVAATELFHFQQISALKIGGTASTASSEVSIASGTSVASVVKGFTLKGTTPLASERFGISTTRSEPLQNGRSDIKLILDCEFGSQSEMYDVFRAGTVTPVEIAFTGSSISGGSNSLAIILSAPKITKAGPQDNEEDLLTQQVEFTVLDDGTNNPCQIKLIGTDTTL